MMSDKELLDHFARRANCSKEWAERSAKMEKESIAEVYKNVSRMSTQEAITRMKIFRAKRVVTINTLGEIQFFNEEPKINTRGVFEPGPDRPVVETDLKTALTELAQLVVRRTLNPHRTKSQQQILKDIYAQYSIQPNVYCIVRYISHTVIAVYIMRDDE
jgi:hypothetical protein